MNTPSKDIAAQLDAVAGRAACSLKGLNADLFYNVVPDSLSSSPAICTALIDNQGAEPYRGLQPNEKQMEMMPIQIRCRHTSPDAAQKLCQTIVDYLRGLGPFVVTGDADTDTWYQCLLQTSAVFLLGQDDRQRWLATVNIVVPRTAVAKET